mgnify:CR=1 FL=1
MSAIHTRGDKSGQSVFHPYPAVLKLSERWRTAKVTKHRRIVCVPTEGSLFEVAAVPVSAAD